MVCDGFKGLPEVVANVWPQTIVQTCIIHLIRNTFHLASSGYWDALRRDVQPIYTAPTADAALAAFEELTENMGGALPGDHPVVGGRWEQFIPFLDYDVEIRQADVLDQRHRSPQCPLPARCQGPRPFPNRASGAKMSLPGDQIP